MVKNIGIQRCEFCGEYHYYYAQSCQSEGNLLEPKIEGSLPPKCPYCRFWHFGVCPKVKSIEYFPDGTIKKVELESDSYFMVTDEMLGKFKTKEDGFNVAE